MSRENFNNTPKTRYESLCDLNFLGLGSQCGSNSSSMITEEIQEAINHPIEDKKFSSASQVVLFCVLTALVLLGAAWIHAPRNYQMMRDVGRNSVNQVILSNY